MNDAGWQPSAALDTLRLRAGMLARVRGYFAAAGVIEVETPLLSRAAVTDVHLESVPAAVAGIGPMFLHTSPEYAMKRLLAAGLGDCYQVCRVFRDGERGSLHNPEFTMIEWYRLGLDASGLMDDVEALVAHAVGDLRPLPRAERLTYRDAVHDLCGIDPMTSSAGEIAAALLAHGIDAPPAVLGDRDALLDLLVSTVAGPRLGRARPTFVYDYPASQAALARIRPGDIPVAERFELYLDGIELYFPYHILGFNSVFNPGLIESAEFIAQRGRTVAVIDSTEFLAPEIGDKRRAEHIERMRELGITMHTQCDVTKITREGVWFKPQFGDREHVIAADTVLLAGTIEPRTELYDACKEFVPAAFTVGDVSGLGLIDKAIREANAIVYGLG